MGRAARPRGFDVRTRSRLWLGNLQDAKHPGMHPVWPVGDRHSTLRESYIFWLDEHQHVAEVPLFSDCVQKEVQALACEGKILRRKAGSTIVEEGTKGIAFFLLLDGTVDIIRQERPLARLMTGDFFGESALLSDNRRNATAIAVTDVEMFTFTRWAFKSVLLGNAKIAYGVARALAARIEAA